MSTIRYDKELERFRNLMLPPATFQEGFRWSSLIGAIFIALLMVPGAMYMQLVAGFGVGPAAQWVTVILFIEVARRAHKHLTRPELFVLFYMAGAVMATPGFGLMWRQFFVQSRATFAMGVAEHVPEWYAPGNPEVLARRSFLAEGWLLPLGLFVFGTFMSRVNNLILGYGLFRIASDLEKLPFPMAPIGAQGIMALAEQSEEEKQRGEGSWRWRVFAIGGVLGLAFGVIYIGLPTVTGALLKKPIQLLPIPFSDWTTKTQEFLPAVATGFNWNLAQLVLGMVLPFFAMLGSFVAMIVVMIVNPILQHPSVGILRSWEPNKETVETLFLNNIDFYFSFSVGIAVAIALAGFWQVYRAVQRARRAKRLAEPRGPAAAPAHPEIDRSNRGDIRTSVVVATYLVSTFIYIGLSYWLLTHYRAEENREYLPNVMGVLIFIGFVYTPLISYVTARLEGMAGQVVQIPMVREAAFILSGYRGGVDVWFLPIPMHNYGRMVVRYRQAELTGTRFWSLWKAEIVLIPIVLLATVFFANFIWSLAEVPSARYPFTERMWDFMAANQCIIYSSTLGHFSEFERALNGWYILAGASVGMVLFAVMVALNWPIMLVYGLIRGLNQTMPHAVLPQFIGAMLGRFYFERRLKLRWRQYIPVVAAGFTCGMGLITVFCVGITFLAKAVIQLPF